jgi:hypothetical protein
MCNCQTWARLPHQGTHDGKYPPPEHHPDCEDFKPEQFSRVEYDGTACIMEPNEAAAMIADGDCQYNVTPVLLTRDQFSRMGEFAGF